MVVGTGAVDVVVDETNVVDFAVVSKVVIFVVSVKVVVMILVVEVENVVNFSVEVGAVVI